MTVDIKDMTPLLQVYDMQESLAFYQALGFRILQQAPSVVDCNWALLEHSGKTLMLNTAYEKDHRPLTPDPTRVLHHRDLTLYFSTPGISQVHQHLKEHGIEIREPQVTTYGFKSITVTDPDGYTICFHWPLQENE